MEINNVRAGYSNLVNGGRKAKAAGEKDFAKAVSDAFRQEEEEKASDENSLQTTEDLMRFIRDRKQEIYDKVRKGETEVKIRIGAQEYTQKEWDKLMESFDETEDDFRKKLREARELQRKAQTERAGEQEDDPAETEEAFLEKLLADREGEARK